jgi:hypothetical protein
MAIDQSPLGNHIQEMMQEIEDDREIPDDAQIARIITIVEVVGSDYSNIRMRSNARPYVAIGFLEVAKEMQKRMLMGS